MKTFENDHSIAGNRYLSWTHVAKKLGEHAVTVPKLDLTRRRRPPPAKGVKDDPKSQTNPKDLEMLHICRLFSTIVWLSSRAAASLSKNIWGVDRLQKYTVTKRLWKISVDSMVALWFRSRARSRKARRKVPEINQIPAPIIIMIGNSSTPPTPFPRLIWPLKLQVGTYRLGLQSLRGVHERFSPLRGSCVSRPCSERSSLIKQIDSVDRVSID